MIRLARQKDLLTTPYVFDPPQATAMAQAGADILRRPHGSDHRRHDRCGNRPES